MPVFLFCWRVKLVEQSSKRNSLVVLYPSGEKDIYTKYFLSDEGVCRDAFAFFMYMKGAGPLCFPCFCMLAPYSKYFRSSVWCFAVSFTKHSKCLLSHSVDFCDSHILCWFWWTCCGWFDPAGVACHAAFWNAILFWERCIRRNFIPSSVTVFSEEVCN